MQMYVHYFSGLITQRGFNDIEHGFNDSSKDHRILQPLEQGQLVTSSGIH